MFHPPPGTSGLITGVGIFLAIGTLAYATRGPGPFNLDPQNRPGAFEPFLAKYVRAGEYVIGLATGSIVLLVGSSALHGQSGRLPWFYASPLLLLAFCVIYGVAVAECILSNDKDKDGDQIIAVQPTNAPCMDHDGETLHYLPTPNGKGPDALQYVNLDILSERVQ